MIVTVDPADADGLRPLSFVEVKKIIQNALGAANYELAAFVSRQLADQLPDNLWSQLAAAESLRLHEEAEAAHPYIDRALAIHPENIAGLIIKARLHLCSGDAEAALRKIDSALDLAPGDSLLHSVKAEMLVDAGQIGLARDTFHRAIKLNHGNADALLGLSQLPGDNFSVALIEKTELAVNTGDLSGDSLIKTHFALAHAYDRKSDTARHFRHLNAGNELKHRQLKFDPIAAEREAEAARTFFSKGFFAKQARAAKHEARQIFIIGFPRCGSTLIEQILSSHPMVAAAGETSALRHSIRELRPTKNLPANYPFQVAEQTAESLSELANIYLQKTHHFNTSDYMTDKMLDNYRFVGMIYLMFPDATIINVQRHPVDVCYSCYKRLFGLNSLPYTYNLEYLASQFRIYQDFIGHWHTVLPGTIHTVQYEDLITRQEEVTSALLEHCGLPWNDACLNFYLNERAVQTNSNSQVRQPLYSSSIGRWRNYQDYLGQLLTLADA